MVTVSTCSCHSDGSAVRANRDAELVIQDDSWSRVDDVSREVAWRNCSGRSVSVRSCRKLAAVGSAFAICLSCLCWAWQIHDARELPPTVFSPVSMSISGLHSSADPADVPTAFLASHLMRSKGAGELHNTGAVDREYRTIMSKLSAAKGDGVNSIDQSSALQGQYPAGLKSGQLRETDVLDSARSAVSSLKRQLADSAGHSAAVKLGDAKESVHKLDAELRELKDSQHGPKAGSESEREALPDVVQVVASAISTESAPPGAGPRGPTLQPQQHYLGTRVRSQGSPTSPSVAEDSHPPEPDVNEAISDIFGDPHQPGGNRTESIAQRAEPDVHAAISSVFGPFHPHGGNATGTTANATEEERKLRLLESEVKGINSKMSNSSYVGRLSATAEAVSVLKPAKKLHVSSQVVQAAGPTVQPTTRSIVIKFHNPKPGSAQASVSAREGGDLKAGSTEASSDLKAGSTDASAKKGARLQTGNSNKLRTPQLSHVSNAGPTGQQGVASSGQSASGQSASGQSASGQSASGHAGSSDGAHETEKGAEGCECCSGSPHCSCCEQGWLGLQTFGKWLLMVLALVLCVMTFLIFGFMCFGCLWAWREFKRQDRWEKFLDGATGSDKEAGQETKAENKPQQGAADKPASPSRPKGAAGGGQAGAAGSSASGRPISKRADSQIAR